MNIAAIIAKTRQLLEPAEVMYGELIFNNNECVLLAQSAVSVDFMVVNGEEEEVGEYSLLLDGDAIVPECAGERVGWNRYTFACLLQYDDELGLLEPKEKLEHKKYTREGMIRRVMEERRMKAETAKYRIQWADNIYGDHILVNDTGQRYKVFLRDFENETGYSDSVDAQINKLGTTKHIMYAFKVLREDPALYKRLKKTFPFVEVYCDPLNEYRISWYYPGDLSLEERLLISRYFKKGNYIEEDQVIHFLSFMEEAEELGTIRIRPEVREKVEQAFDVLMLRELEERQEVDFSGIHAELFPYQQEGVRFALFRKYAIIADEMGLGKTLQAIATAVLKKQVFGFNKTLVVCPATLKSQWKREIEKFTDEKALVLAGTPGEREKQYLDTDYHFFIVNYEMVLRDSQLINRADFDFLILDEAQKIKNYETKTSMAVKRLKMKHTLVITGTPIENKLIDIFSIVSALDPHFLGPLWEFSYQHCLFDPEKPNKINGYYDLKKLNQRLSQILIRRSKQDVIRELPDVQQIDIPVKLSSLQQEYHSDYIMGVSKIIRKKFLTAYDLQRLMLLLNCARMVCDSTYLIDEKTQESPKLEELKDILFEKLDIRNQPRKVIIFSEWIKVHKLIGQMLRENKIGFVELNGKVPVKMRGELIRKFKENRECQVFLSTEAGGAGLNLQMADILINFELPWNPAKKNQRIGRIDRLGQESKKLTIYNLISEESIEQQIAGGLLVKQSLFDGVLTDNSRMNYVDFSHKGRSQFIQQLEQFINEQEAAGLESGVQELVLQEEMGIIETPDGEEPVRDMDDLEQLEQEEEQRNEEQYDADSGTSTTASVAGAGSSNTSPSMPAEKAAELESVMNNGMQFLAGLFKMSTGQDLDLQHQKIEVDRETGEVVMRFKLS